MVHVVKGLLRMLVAVMAIVLGAVSGLAQMRTDRFDVSILIKPDRSLVVKETIKVRFTEPRRGIIRWIPLYRGDGASGRSIRTSLQSVTLTRNGQTIQERVATSSDGYDWNIKIGKAEKAFTGEAVYVLRYTVRDALTDFPPDKQYGARTELYWNAVPHQWDSSIAASEVKVTFPKAVEGDLRSRLLLGHSGTRQGIEIVEGSSEVVGNTDLVKGRFGGRGFLRLEAGRALKKEEGLTVILGLPKGTMPEEPYQPVGTASYADSYYEEPYERPWSFDFSQIELWAVLLPFAPLVLYGIFRWKPWAIREPLVVRFDPPEGLGAAEAGYLVDAKLHPRDLAGGIVSLAQKGALDLRRTGPDLLIELFSKSGSQPLTVWESALYGYLYEHGAAINSSDLKGVFWPAFQNLQSLMRSEMTLQRLVAPEYLNAFPAGLTTLGAIVAGVYGFQNGGGFWVFLTMLPAVFIGLIWIGSTVPFTKEGERARRQIRGLEEFIRRAHKEGIAHLTAVAPDQALYERLLPYAVALGLAPEWAKAFDGRDIARPQWYYGETEDWWLSSLSMDLSSLAHQTRNWVGDNYRGGDGGSWSGGSSSWWSGSSGFGGGWSSGGGGGFSGGGSSGGGAGGGGGGSW